MALFIKSRHEKEAQTSSKRGANQFEKGRKPVQREKQSIGLWFDDLDDLVEIQNFHNLQKMLDFQYIHVDRIDHKQKEKLSV